VGSELCRGIRYCEQICLVLLGVLKQSLKYFGNEKSLGRLSENVNVMELHVPLTDPQRIFRDMTLTSITALNFSNFSINHLKTLLNEV
jgi:tellurite resistance-related uncharacterized protein